MIAVCSKSLSLPWMNKVSYKKIFGACVSLKKSLIKSGIGLQVHLASIYYVVGIIVELQFHSPGFITLEKHWISLWGCESCLFCHVQLEERVEEQLVCVL